MMALRLYGYRRFANDLEVRDRPGDDDVMVRFADHIATEVLERRDYPFPVPGVQAERLNNLRWVEDHWNRST